MRINLNRFTYLFAVIVAVFALINPVWGQEKLSKEELAQYKEEVTQMVNYLKFSLNILGDSSVSAKEKDVIINDSYLKIFRNANVQIEDDLVKTRDVVTNKDVQAYLKDVDFFFKWVKFEFNISDISYSVNAEGQLFFTVQMMRNLTGVTVEGDSIDTNQERYIEINVDEENKDLRIASIYTTGLSRDEQLAIWWAGLDEAWRTVLGLDIEVKPGLRLSEIYEFSDSTYVSDGMELSDTLKIINFVKIAAGKETINLKGSRVITDIKPLDQLKNLRSLDISSSDITDIFPIRNLTTLEFLDCSNTMVEDIEPLKYSKSLKKLYINNTPVTSIMVVENFENLEVLSMATTVIDSLPSTDRLTKLKELNCSGTNLAELAIISKLKSLVNLNISNTGIENPAPLANLTNLQELDITLTNITALDALGSLANLQTLRAEQTEVADLMPLQKLKKLSAVYVDDSKISMEAFLAFASVRPDVKVYFMSGELMVFWSGLNEPWKAVISPKLSLGDTVTGESLFGILQIKEINISGNSALTTLDPVKYMPFLQELIFSETVIADLAPAAGLTKLEVLNGAQSAVIDLTPVKGLKNLKTINFEKTAVSDISPLSGCQELDTLIFNTTKVKNIDVLNLIKNFKIAYFDYSLVGDEDAYNLDYSNTASVVVYKSDLLRSWWGNMDDAWQDIFKESDQLDDRPTTVQLHRIAAKQSLDLNSTSLKSLDPINEFVRLESLTFKNTRISSLAPLTGLKKLKELNCPGNPISDLSALSSLATLQVLDLDDTQVDDLKPLQNLSGLRQLKFNGTNVKDVSPVEGLTNLEVLEFAKTRVKQVNDLTGLKNLKVLKCYNNKISPKKIEDFKLSNPDCEVVFY